MSQRDVVDKFVGLILDHVHGIDGVEPTVCTDPHKIISVHIVRVSTERTLAELKHYFVLPAVKTVVCTNSHLITRNVVPIFRTEIEVYRSAVVLVAPDAYNLLTHR